MSKFKVGDRVRILRRDRTLPVGWKGFEAEVVSYFSINGTWLRPLSERPDGWRLDEFSWSTNDLELVTPTPDSGIDGLIAEHAQKLQDVYDNRTAGDNTFLGALAMFLRDVDRARAR